MAEEFHGVLSEDGTVVAAWKQLYGWNTINTNIWLPSMSELVGIIGMPNTETGTCLSAMQGLNLSINTWTDAQGGVQFSYFQQYNASGGGQRIWDACSQQTSWLRSTAPDNAIAAWFTNLTANRFDWTVANALHAVHPAVLYNP